MNLKPVKSSNIESVGHDPDAKAMFVKFKSGQTHRYDDVSPEKHAALMAADSVGSHFHQHIRNSHKSARVDG